MADAVEGLRDAAAREFEAIRKGLRGLEERVNARFDGMEQRFGARFDGIDARFDELLGDIRGKVIPMLEIHETRITALERNLGGSRRGRRP